MVELGRANETEFEVGQRVLVNPTHYDASPAWEGTILGYHRNGDWVVREDRHRTHAAYHRTRLAAVEVVSCLPCAGTGTIKSRGNHPSPRLIRSTCMRCGGSGRS